MMAGTELTLPDRLQKREGRMAKIAVAAFADFGAELGKIKQERDWMHTYGSWGDYCTGRWGFSKRQGDRLINAAAVVRQLRNGTPGSQSLPILPEDERQARPLTEIEVDARPGVWQVVVEEAPRGPGGRPLITPTFVADKVAEWRLANGPGGGEVDVIDVEAEVAEDDEPAEAAEEAEPGEAPATDVGEVTEDGWEPKEYYTLDEWKLLSGANKRAATEIGRTSGGQQFNKQDTDSIKWARWSWNPVTGCRQDCNYCYARDIANRFFPQKFEPAFYPGRLRCPGNTTVPDKAETEIGWKNVFTCSMADLFGKWVPKAWIDAVLGEVWAAPQWNFLFLTKSPRRLLDFDFPDNAWVGTTVDKQSRVAAAEEVFGKVKAGVKFLSVEPMWEPIKFSKLRLFDWVIIGGASRSSETEAFTPTRTSAEDWVFDLEAAARKAGCAIYEKENLMELIQDYPGMTQ